MGGRGANDTKGMGGGVNPDDIISEKNMISEREGRRDSVDRTLTVLRDIQDRYGVNVDTVLSELKPGASNVMGYYSPDSDVLGINNDYFNESTMNESYDRCVKTGYHPGRGDKTGLEAVTAHELGHKLTQEVANRHGLVGIDDAAGRIMKTAARKLGSKTIEAVRSKISGYAKDSDAESVAEAFADVYCNGNKASSASIAVVDALDYHMRRKKK